MASKLSTIEKYTEVYPDSLLLRELHTAVGRSRGLSEEWWNALTDNESPESTAARAAAFMLEWGTKPKSIDDTLGKIDQLQPGVPIATAHWDYSSRYSGYERKFIIPYLSGVLRAMPRAMPESKNLPHPGLGMLFEDRDSYEVTPVFPLSRRMMIGDEEIAAFYGEAVASPEAEYQLHPRRDSRIGSGLLALIDTMTRLGIEYDDQRITALHDAAKVRLSEYIAPSRIIHRAGGAEYDSAVLEDLPVLHRLDPQQGEEKVREYAMRGMKEDAWDKPGYWIFEKQLTKALARIRSAEGGWWFEGMKELRQKWYMSNAAAELDRMRLEADNA